MLERWLADLVLVFHLAFILFAVAGGLLALRWRRIAIAQLLAALWAVGIELSGGLCPLTPLENHLRRAAGAAGYSGGFVEHYLVAAIYPAALSERLQLLLAALVVLANAGTYALVWRKLRAERSASAR